MLYQVFYTSEMTPNFTGKDLTEVLETSRINNAADDLTGLLITHNRQFFQCLEGPKDLLEKRFGRIARDPRHSGLAIVGKGPIKERSFPSWKMAFESPEKLPFAARQSVFAIYDLVPPRSPDRSEDPTTQAQIRQFLASFGQLAA